MKEMYKSLVYKEWKVGKGFYLVRALFVLLFSGLCACCMIVFSQQGSIDENAIGAFEFFAMVMLYLLSACIAAVVADNDGIYKRDVNFGWLRFTKTLPVTAHDLAMGRYLFKGTVIMAGTVFMLVAIGGISVITGFKAWASPMYLYFWVVAVLLAFEIIRTLFLMRADDKKKFKRTLIITEVIVTIIGILVYLMIEWRGIDAFSSFQMEEQNFLPIVEELSFSHPIGILGILFSIILFVAGFMITRKSYERSAA